MRECVCVRVQMYFGPVCICSWFPDDVTFGDPLTFAWLIFVVLGEMSQRLLDGLPLQSLVIS